MMSYDYQNPNTKKRRRCSKCGAFLGPAATYCDRCGASASGIVKRRSWPLVLIVLIIAGAVYFHYADINAIDRIKQVVNEIIASYQEPAPEKPKPVPAKPQAKPQTMPENTKPTKPAPTQVQQDVPSLKVGRTYQTQRGFVASLKKEWLLEFKKQERNGNKQALDKMREKKQIGNLKAGLNVELLEMDARDNWAKVRIQGKNTVFYTAAEALVD